MARLVPLQHKRFYVQRKNIGVKARMQVIRPHKYNLLTEPMVTLYFSTDTHTGHISFNDKEIAQMVEELDWLREE